MVLSLDMGWRHVLFANWPVDPEIVRPHLPEGLTIDTYDGDAWLSVIPFTNVDVRPSWAPEVVGFALPELNLRTYVTHENGREREAGVYFFSLDAEGILGVLGARVFHYLPYYYARITLDVDGGTAAGGDRANADAERAHEDPRTDEDGHTDGDERPTVAFTSRRRHPGARPAAFRATYRPTGDRLAAPPGSLAHFLTERYRYYTESPRGRLRYAAIEHESWPLYPADVSVAENTLFRANAFDEPGTEAVHYYSPGVDTIASRSRRVRE